MARINQGILGPILGSLGKSVGCVRYGRPYIRTKPISYHDAKSQMQLEQRARRTACIELYRWLRFSIGRPVWNLKACGKSGYNLFMGANMMKFDGHGNIADFNNLKIAIGDLPLPKGITASFTNAGKGEISITWVNDSVVGNALPSDILRLVVICNKKRAF